MGSSSSNSGTIRRCKLETAPGTELWFQNDRLRLFNVMMKPGESVSWESANPLVRWVVGGAEFTETRSDDPKPAKLVLPDKTVRFYDAISGVTWKLCNDGAGPAREIVFELLDDRPRHTEEEVEAMRRACAHSPRVGTALLLENGRVRAWDFSYPPGGPAGGAPDEVHQHTLDYVFCTPCGGPAAVGGCVRLLGYNPDGSLQFDSVSRDGEVHWTTVTGGGFRPAGAGPGREPDPAFCHAGRNGYDDRPFVEYLLELK